MTTPGSASSASDRETGVAPNTETPVLRLAIKGSKRSSGILASTYAQTASSDQEIISVGDDCCISVVVGSADRYLIRGFSWNSDDTTVLAAGVTHPWHLIAGSTKLFRLSLTRNISGVPEYSAPQGATVEGGSTKTYALSIDWDAYRHVGSGSRTGHVLIRIHGTQSTNFDTPSTPGVTFSEHGDDVSIPELLAAILGEPLHAMVQNLGQADNGHALADITNAVLSQGFTTGPTPGGYRLQGIGVNIEGSGNNFPDGPTSVSVAVHADSGGKPGAKLFDLLSPTEYAGGPQLLRGAGGNDAGGEYLLCGGVEPSRRHWAQVAEDSEQRRGLGRADRLQHRERVLSGRRPGQPVREHEQCVGDRGVRRGHPRRDHFRVHPSRNRGRSNRHLHRGPGFRSHRRRDHCCHRDQPRHQPPAPQRSPSAPQTGATPRR